MEEVFLCVVDALEDRIEVPDQCRSPVLVQCLLVYIVMQRIA